MDNPNGGEDVAKIISEVAGNLDFEVLDTTAFLDGIDRLYRGPSLSQVVDEELPRIIEAESRFFERNGIELPRNQESCLFDLYYSKHGRAGMERVLYSAKVWFRHIRFFLIDHPDQNELNHAVEEYKRILDGRYFDCLS